MRYTSRFSEARILSTSGKTLQRFYQGELTVGTPTTNVGTGNALVFTPVTDIDSQIMRVSPDATTYDAMCGMGNLTSAGTYCAGFFYEAPPISLTTNTLVTLTANRIYEVLSGDANYNGSNYAPDQSFTVVTANTAATSTATGKVALSPYNCGAKESCCDNLQDWFNIVIAKKADEKTFKWSDGGFVADNSLVSTDSNFFAKI